MRFGLLILLFASIASADSLTTILSVNGPQSGGAIGPEFEGGGAILAEQWTQSTAFSGVNIAADIYPNYNPASPGPDEVYAWLVTQVGAGTTTQQQVAASVVNLQYYEPNTTEFVYLFYNLNLGPGEYYLVLSSPSHTGGGAWAGTSAADATVITAPGVSTNTQNAILISSANPGGPNLGVPDYAYPPDSTFVSLLTVPNVNTLGINVLKFEVTSGYIAPEPRSLFLFVFGLSLLGMTVLGRGLRDRRHPL